MEDYMANMSAMELDKFVRRNDWTEEEDKRLIEITSTNRKWAEVSKLFPGRDAYTCFSRWHTFKECARMKKWAEDKKNREEEEKKRQEREEEEREKLEEEKRSVQRRLVNAEAAISMLTTRLEYLENEFNKQRIKTQFKGLLIQDTHES